MAAWRTHQFWLGRWSGPSGYRALLALAFPLILSTGSHSIQLFVDRMFLSWHNPLALAASATAGLLSFTVVSFFFGTAAYVSTFVAQYHGAGRPNRISAAMWQSIYFSLVSGGLILLFIPLGPLFFRWFGHEADVQRLEVVYFQLLCVNGPFVVLGNALAGFFSGRGRPWPVVWVSVSGTVVNLGLDYAWIFGKAGLPEWGIAGAGCATIVAGIFSVTLYLLLFFSPANRREFGTWRMRRPDWTLMRRLMRYGLPSGVQFMLDILCFTLFIGFTGRLGLVELASTNLALQVDLLAYIPMVGAGIATSVLVGQFLGAKQPQKAAEATWNAYRLTFLYLSVMAILYLSVPDFFIGLFFSGAEHGAGESIRPMAIAILRFVAVYTLFDGLGLIFGSALKGAGDTRFVMFYSFLTGLLVMVLPTWWISRADGPETVWGLSPLQACWLALTLFVMVLGLGMMWRFWQGHWRSIRVIEEEVGEQSPAEASAEHEETL